MKTTQIYTVNTQELRGSVRARLTERAQFVAKGLKSVIATNLTEAYSDNPMSPNDKIPHYSKEDVRKMLSTWETPNQNDDHYEDNFNNPVHRSKEGVEKLEKGDGNAKDVAGNGSAIEVGENNTTKDPNFDRANTIRLMKDLYFLESEYGTNTTYIDTTDGDTSDEDAFKNALLKAQTLGEVIELELDDGNTIDLDVETIAKILATDDIFHKLMASFTSLESVTSLLGIDIADEDGTSNGFYESEDESDDKSVLINGPVFLESVLDYLDSSLPEAFVTVNEAFFAESPKSIDEISATLSEAMDERSPNNRNYIARGRAAMVNRVRGGKLQLRKVVSDSKGYKIVAGVAVRMQPSEIKKRRIGARFASKKRRNVQAGINRKTKISMRLHARRLGN